jgi:hypothetical protein
VTWSDRSSGMGLSCARCGSRNCPGPWACAKPEDAIKTSDEWHIEPKVRRMIVVATLDTNLPAQDLKGVPLWRRFFMRLGRKHSTNVREVEVFEDS